MTLFELATRFIGEVTERAGAADEPFIQWCHASCGLSPDTPDEVAWCSSFQNRLAWILRLPRSKSAAARSWLTVGFPISVHEATAANDIVILKRGSGEQPGPEVIAAPGHVGLFAGLEGDRVLILGGNQSDGVTLASFPASSVLGVRRLA